MLEKLESKFIDELRVLEKEEMNRKASHDLLQQSLSDQFAPRAKCSFFLGTDPPHSLHLRT